MIDNNGASGTGGGTKKINIPRRNENHGSGMRFVSPVPRITSDSPSRRESKKYLSLSCFLETLHELVVLIVKNIKYNCIFITRQYHRSNRWDLYISVLQLYLCWVNNILLFYQNICTSLTTFIHFNRDTEIFTDIHKFHSFLNGDTGIAMFLKIITMFGIFKDIDTTSSSIMCIFGPFGQSTNYTFPKNGDIFIDIVTCLKDFICDDFSYLCEKRINSYDLYIITLAEFQECVSNIKSLISSYLSGQFKLFNRKKNVYRGHYNQINRLLHLLQP
jgi:hypothetical protein